MRRKINTLVNEVFSGEWGDEPSSSDAVNVIRTSNFDGKGKINYDEIAHRHIEIQKIEEKRLIEGDVLIEKSGGGPNQPVGRVAYFMPPDRGTYICNNFTAVLRVDRSLIVPKYFFYALHYNHLIGRTRNFQNKTTGISNLQLSRYLNESIPLPSISEQVKIVTILDKCQSILEKREKIITAITLGQAKCKI